MRLLVCATVLVVLSAGAAHAEGTAGAGNWSQPATLSSCPGTGPPQVVFPSDKPTHGTGPGAIVWSASLPCAGGAGVRVASISPEDVPGQPTEPHTAAGRSIVLRGPVAATGGPYGRVIVAAAGGTATAAGELLLTEGPAGGPFATPTALGGPASTFAFTTAYLGDVALVSLGDADGIQLRVQRHHAYSFTERTRMIAASGASIGALTVALDFRSDALAVWARGSSVYARDLPASGAPHPVERLGAVGLGPPSGARIAAVLSDDDRAIVAWTDRRAGQTSVYVAQSQAGVRFGAPRLLERFPDPPDLPAYADSPEIVRLSLESVMIAWTGAEDGHWVIRTAAIDLNGVGAASTISPPGRDALLADLTAGPDDEALALWSEPQPTPAGLDLGRQALFAARGFDASPGRTIFAAGEQVAPPGPNGDATVALDPNSDRAVAAWRTGAGAIAYATRAAGAP